MRVYVSTERHALRTKDGVFAEGAESYAFFRRYLEGFDEVVVLARVSEVEALPEGAFKRADGEKVRFLDLPDFHGWQQALSSMPLVATRLAPALSGGDGAFVLRVPGAVSTLCWLALRTARHPFGLEVVTDPMEAYTRAALGSWAATPLRVGSLKMLRSQCASAACVAYVTQHALQARYPARTPDVFSYSSIDLDPVVFERARGVTERLEAHPDVLAPARLIFVGNLGRPFKGLDVLLEALPLVRSGAPAPQLTVVGDGQLRPRYEAMARELGVAQDVDFRGHVPSGDPVYDILVESDILVLPSRREGLPRVVIEGMAVGLPCVSTDVSGARELLAEGDIVPKDDPPALARRIAKMIVDKRDRMRAAERNRANARRFERNLLQQERNRFYRALTRASSPCAS